jgi:small-conductance mechanosensitive channel
LGVRGFSVAAALGASLVCVLGTASAEPEAVPPEAAASATTDPAGPRIDTATDAATDRAIERRLRGIFSELDGLGDVRIAARDGVVQLSGETLSADLRERAVRLARQVQGVAEVEDRIEEVRDVQRRIAPVVDRLVQRGWDLVAVLPLFVVALLIVGAFWLFGWIVGRWDAPFRRLSRNRFLSDLLQQVVRVAIVLAGVVVALEVLDAGALVGTVLGAAGILGLALGFALRDTVENYIASLLLSLRQPFGHDDLVLIEGWEGRVLRLTSRATVLMTLDGNHVRIPNATVYKSVIVNYSRNPARAFEFDLGIDPAEDLAAVQQLGADTLLGMDGVMEDPPPVASVEAIGDSTVTVRLLGWVDQRHADFLKVRSEAIRLVKQAYDTAGVNMPEPRYGVTFAGVAADPAAGGPEPGRERLAPRGPTVAIDIAPRDDLDRHISGERRGHSEDDLLTPGAPEE